MDYHTGNSDIDKELDDRFALLSPTVQALIAGEQITEFSEKISRRFNLTADEKASVSDRIMLILMCIDTVDDLFNNLVVEELINPIVADYIVESAKKDLFAPIVNEIIFTVPPDSSESKIPSEIRPEDFKPIAQGSGVPVPPTGPAATPAPSMRVMPHTPEEAAASQARSGTELPDTLIKNLKASLAHSAAETPYREEAELKSSYRAMLDTKPPAQQ